MRIGLLTTSFPRHAADPAGRFVAELGEALADGGDQIEVVAPRLACSSDPRVVVHAIPGPARSPLFFGAGAPDNLLAGPWPARVRAWLEVPSSLAAMAWVTRRRMPAWDAAISHWILPCGLLAAACARRLPQLAVAHSSDVHLLARWPGASRALAHLARPRSGLVLTSESLRPLLLKRARSPRARGWIERGQVVRMGVWPAPALSPVAVAAHRRRHGLEQTTVVLFLGRLVPVKGVDRLIDALPERVTLVVVGDGPLRPALERLARRRRRPVRFVGVSGGADKQLWLQAADLLAVPSRVLADGRTDSAPVVLLEAMAAGLPVIASRVGGAAELIADGENGLLVPADDTAVLRQAIAALAADPARRAALARAGRRTAERHHWPRVAERLRALLRSL